MSEVERKIEQPAVSETPTGNRPDTLKVGAGEKCTHCGAPLPHLTRSGREMVIPAGSLDDAPGFMPQVRIYWDSRVEWSGSADGVPTSGELPEWWR